MSCKVPIVAVIILLTGSLALADQSSSTNFIIERVVIDSGGTSASSSNFNLKTSEGQNGPGISSSTTFIIRGGFLNFVVPTASTASTSTSTSASSGGTPLSGSGGGGGGTGYYSSSQPPVSTLTVTPAPTLRPTLTPAPVAIVADTVQAALQKLKSIISSLLPGAAPPQAQSPLLTEQIVPKITPRALRGEWALILPSALGNFVLAPLPKELSLLTEKLPKLKQSFENLGITGAATIPKLQGVQLNLSGLTESTGLVSPELASGRLVMPPGIPLAELSPRIKQGIPSEVVFARSSDEKIDLNIMISLGSNGELEKTINAVAGSRIRLVVKPQALVQSVRGYLLLRNGRNSAGIGMRNHAIDLQSALASLVFQVPQLAQSVPPSTVNIEQRLALQEFEYTDRDHDGIYIADVKVPNISGQYDIITLISYKDPDLGTRKIGLTAVIDPEGYVYEQSGDKQTRIPNATVTIFWLNPATNAYELWPANQYSQKNPQVTNVLGTYVFLVPAGSYYIAVQAKGYYPYTSQSFTAERGNQIHDNIELHSSNWFVGWDWKSTLIIAVVVLLLANFYWDRRRERAMRHGA